MWESHGAGAGLPLPFLGMTEVWECVKGPVDTMPPPQGLVYTTWTGGALPQQVAVHAARWVNLD